MLGRNFIKINSTTIPTPATYTGSPTNIEDVNESEAGTERVVVTRLLKKEAILSLSKCLNSGVSSYSLMAP